MFCDFSVKFFFFGLRGNKSCTEPLVISKSCKSRFFKILSVFDLRLHRKKNGGKHLLSRNNICNFFKDNTKTAKKTKKIFFSDEVLTTRKIITFIKTCDVNASARPRDVRTALVVVNSDGRALR